jgi:hypothetical protein
VFAELLAKQLMQRGQFGISDHALHKLVYAIAEKTDLVSIPYNLYLSLTRVVAKESNVLVFFAGPW